MQTYVHTQINWGTCVLQKIVLNYIHVTHPPQRIAQLLASVACPEEFNRGCGCSRRPSIGNVECCVIYSLCVRTPAPSLRQASFSQRGMVRKKEHQNINPLL